MVYPHEEALLRKVLREEGVVARPKGGIIEVGSITTTSTYQVVASRTVTAGKRFLVTKTLVSCDQDVLYKMRWDGNDISIEILVPAKTPFPDWYPYGYKDMVGDGSKAFEIQAKYPSGGSAGACSAEIEGEEI